MYNNIDLNKTDDFASGATPYKLAACKTVTNIVTKTTKTRRRDVKLPKMCYNASSATMNLVGQDDDCVTEKSQTEISVKKGASSSEIGDEHNKKVCQNKVSGVEYATKVNTCVRAMFSRDGKQQLSCNKTDGTEDISCLICQADVTELSPFERNRHVSNCMDGQTAEKRKMDDCTGENKNAKECHVCKQDLSYMIASGRLLHINMCIDKKARQKPKQSKPKLVKERELDCPLCGQLLKTHNARKTHMKNCAKKLNVGTVTLMARIKQQEDEHKSGVGVRSGIPAAGLATKTKRGARDRGARPLVEQTRPTCVERQLQEETQLALAMSHSLIENDSKLNTGLAGCERHGSTHIAKDAYAILMSPPKTSKPTRKIKKKHRDPEYTPALLVETQTEKQNKLARRISQMMTNSQTEEDIASTPEFKASDIRDVYKSADVSRQTCSDLLPKGLWESSGVEPKNVALDAFYVKQINPPVEMSNVTVGSKFNKMSNIAGWSSLQERDVLEKTRINVTLNESMVPSTQTAVVLAQLAADQTTLLGPADTSQTHDDSAFSRRRTDHELPVPYQSKLIEHDHVELDTSVKRTSLPSPREQTDASEQFRGFMANIEDTKLDNISRKAVKSLLAGFSSLVDNPKNSDISIIAADETTICAHNFVLNLRCPDLLQICEDGVINLEHIEKDTILALLRYVYAADLHICSEQVVEVKQLAERYNLIELSEICVNMLQQSTANKHEFDFVIQQSNRCERNKPIQSADETLQNLLHQVWGSDSEQSSDESVTESTCARDDRLIDEGLNEDEYDDVYIAMTQQNRKDKVTEESFEVDEVQHPESVNYCDESRSPMSRSGYFTNKPNLNMTLHEQMTHILLHGDESSSDSNTNQSIGSVSSDHSYLVIKPRDSVSTHAGEHENDGDVSETDSVSVMEVQFSSLAQDVNISKTVHDTSLNDVNKTIVSNNVRNLGTSFNDTAFPCSQVATPVQFSRNVSVLSTSPDLFQDSPEVNRSCHLNSNATIKSSCEHEETSRLRSPPSVCSQKITNTSVELQNLVKYSDSSPLRNLTSSSGSFKCVVERKRRKTNSSRRKAHELSDSETEGKISTSLRTATHSSESDSCEIVKEWNVVCTDDCSSPVLQTQMSQAHHSEQTLSDRSQESIRKKSARAVRDLSDQFSTGRSLYDSASRTCQNESNKSRDPFANKVLYESCVKYSPKRGKHSAGHSNRPIADSSSDATDTRFTKRKLSETKSYKTRDKKQRISDPLSNSLAKIDRTLVTRRAETNNWLGGNSPQTEKHERYSDMTLESPANSSPDRTSHKTGDQQEMVKSQFLSPTNLNDSHSPAHSFKRDSRVIDLSDLSPDVRCHVSEINSGVSSPIENVRKANEASTSRLLPAKEGSSSMRLSHSPDVAVNDNADVWADFEDDGFNDMAFVSPLSQHSTKSCKSTSVCKKSSIGNSEISANISQANGACMDNLDLGSSFSESQPSQKTGKINEWTNGTVLPTLSQPMSRASHPETRRTNDDGKRYEGESCYLRTVHNSHHSPVRRKTRNAESSSNESSVILSDLSDLDEQKKEHCVHEYDPPTDISMNAADADTSIPLFSGIAHKNQNCFKTPTASRHVAKKKPQDWIPPSPFTPKPDYASLPTPKIQREAEKLGLRKFPKKRAIVVLQSVYEDTHSYETDPEFDQEAIQEFRKKNPLPDDRTPALSVKPNASKRVKDSTKRTSNDKKRSGKETVGANLKLQTESCNIQKGGTNTDKRRVKHALKTTATDSSASGASASHKAVYDASSEDSKLNTSMENSDCEDVLEETILQCSPSKNLSKRDVTYKRQQMWDFIQKNDDLYVKMLHYEPLEFDEFHTMLKDSGLGVGTNIVSEFLDDKGIPYTMRKLRQEKPTRQKKRKPKKLATTSASQTSN